MNEEAKTKKALISIPPRNQGGKVDARKSTSCAAAPANMARPVKRVRLHRGSPQRCGHRVLLTLQKKLKSSTKKNSKIFCISKRSKMRSQLMRLDELMRKFRSQVSTPLWNAS